jgi:hypothetical protein
MIYTYIVSRIITRDNIILGSYDTSRDYYVRYITYWVHVIPRKICDNIHITTFAQMVYTVNRTTFIIWYDMIDINDRLR